MRTGLKIGDKFKAIANAPLDIRVHNSLSVADSAAAAKGAVYVASHVDVPPPRKDEVIAALNPLAEQSRKGPGNQGGREKSCKESSAHGRSLTSPRFVANMRQ